MEYSGRDSIFHLGVKSGKNSLFNQANFSRASSHNHPTIIHKLTQPPSTQALVIINTPDSFLIKHHPRPDRSRGCHRDWFSPASARGTWCHNKINLPVIDGAPHVSYSYENMLIPADCPHLSANADGGGGRVTNIIFFFSRRAYCK